MMEFLLIIGAAAVVFVVAYVSIVIILMIGEKFR
jgi:hypothetical protein